MTNTAYMYEAEEKVARGKLYSEALLVGEWSRRFYFLLHTLLYYETFFNVDTVGIARLKEKTGFDAGFVTKAYEKCGGGR